MNPRSASDGESFRDGESVSDSMDWNRIRKPEDEDSDEEVDVAGVPENQGVAHRNEEDIEEIDNSSIDPLASVGIDYKALYHCQKRHF